MRTSDELFQLIKSLSKSEKRYFKLFASLYGGKKNYLRLFEAIDAQAQYDEERLRQRFKGEKFIRQLSAAKRYLRDQILRSLRAYQTETSARARLREMLHNIEILYERQLAEQARREFDAALELAGEHEDFIGMMSVLSWKEKLDARQWSDEGGISAIYAPLRSALEKYLNYIDHSEAGRWLTLPMRGDQVRTSEELEAMELAMRMLPEEELSVRAAAVHAASRAVYHYARREYREGLAFAERRVRLLEDHPALILADPVNYVRAVCNQMVHLIAVGEVDRFWETLRKLQARSREFLEKNMALGERVRAQIFVTVYGNQMSLVVGLRAVEHYAALAAEVEAGLARHASFIMRSELQKTHHLLSVLHLGAGDHRRALEHNLTVVRENPPEQGYYTWYHARLMQLVIHYEMGNLDLLEYLVKSTYRYFRSRSIMHRFEETVLDFFRRALRADGGRADMLALFADARARFAELAGDPLESHFFLYFDYIHWLDEKIESLGTRRPGADGIRLRREGMLVGAAR